MSEDEKSNESVPNYIGGAFCGGRMYCTTLIVQNNEADSIEKLEKRYKKAKKRLDECYEEADALYNLINGYRQEMTSIIKSKGGMTRVGRNDVYWNMKSVCNAIEDIEDVKSCHMIISSLEIGKTEEEIQAMQRNYDKIHDTIWGVIFPQMKQDVSSSYKKLKDYYSNEITDYENKDDEYKRKSEAIRAQYSSPWELFKQCGIDIVETVWKILKGAGMAVVDILKGLYSIGNMIYYSASGGVAAIAYLVCPDTPAWADDALGESEEYFGNIAYALSHPIETIESMAQSTSDSYEKEGLSYMASYVIADFLIGKAVSGAGKADEVTEVAGATSKAEDVVEFAGDSRHFYDDLDNIDEIDDFYDGVYDPYYKEQFDPVKDGTIADPSDVTEVAGKGGRYTEAEIQRIINNLKGDGFKNNPLRQAYENEVAGLKEYGEKLLASGMLEKEVAQILNQARRDLGVKYKDMTPQPLRDYIYEVNKNRYEGDKLGPTYEYLKKKGKSDRQIIDSASKPNDNIDALLSKFEEWLRRQ